MKSKSIFIILFFILVAVTNSFADDFVVKSFKKIQNDLTARTEKRTDRNDENCAIIKIKTDLTGLTFDSNLGITGDISYNKGVYKIYVSSGERQISIRKTGFVPLDYTLPLPIEELTVYEMVLTNKNKGNENGIISIITTPAGADVFLDGNNTSAGKTPFVQKLSTGEYEYRIVMANYKTEKGNFTITTDNTTDINKNLKKVKSDFVKIYSTPAGADVYLDNELKGTTPFEQLVQEGTYKYRIDKKKYYTEQGDIIVEVGKTPTINVNLKPKFGSFSINSTPTDAEIYLNDKQTGKRTPATFEFQDAGNYNITLKKFNYLDKKHNFTLDEGENENINIELTPNFAGITINSTPETGADITLDYKDVNFKTPHTFPKLTSGEHTVRVSKKMYKPIEKSFTVIAGQSQTITLQMQPTFANVTITATPADAKIYIDGTQKNTGKYAGKLNEGLHNVEIKKDNYVTQKYDINIIAGKEQNLTYKLLPRLGNIAVSTSPTNADIYIKNQKKGTSPLVLYGLIIGTYIIEARKTGFAPTTKTVIIKENETIQTSLTLESGLTVTINSQPQAANIYIDGTNKGKAPQTISLNFGEHTVKLTGIDKYKDTEHTINIRQGGKTNYTLNLKSEATQNMVYVKGGTFQMGSNEQSREKPIHSVTVSDFYISKYEVTFEEYDKFCNATNRTKPSDRGWGRGKRPVINVSWNDATAYSEWLSQEIGENYRLPTEAEWEYAARGGDASRGHAPLSYAGINDESSLGNYAWYSSNSGKKTHPVGTKSLNKLGIYDMSGNVWEWCSDWYDSEYYKKSLKNNPENLIEGSSRVLRGGSWDGNAYYCRVTDRDGSNPAYGSNDGGFRLVRAY